MKKMSTLFAILTLMFTTTSLSASAVVEYKDDSVDLSYTLPGTVTQAECHSRTGDGAVVIQRLEENVLVSTWYKVHSKKLCGATVNHPMFFGKVSPLVALATDNLNGPPEQRLMSQPIFDAQGFLVDLRTHGSEPSMDFEAHQVRDMEPVLSWLLAQPSDPSDTITLTQSF